MTGDYSCPEECTRDAVEALQAENEKLRAVATLVRQGLDEGTIRFWGGGGIDPHFGWDRKLADALEALGEVRCLA